MDSKGDVKHFFGVRFAWHVPESCCCSSVSQLRLQGISANGFACSRGQKIVVLWIPKVTWSTFSACVLLGMCPNPAAVRVFRNCASKGFLLMVLLEKNIWEKIQGSETILSLSAYMMMIPFPTLMTLVLSIHPSPSSHAIVRAARQRQEPWCLTYVDCSPLHSCTQKSP